MDREQVMHMPGFKVGFLPPLIGSLAMGEMFVEIPEEGAPRMWMGMPKTEENPAGMVVMTGPASDPREPTPVDPEPVEEEPAPEAPAEEPKEEEPTEDPPERAARGRFRR